MQECWKRTPDFLQYSDADWILFDFVPYWISQEIGPNLGIKTTFFSIFILQSLEFVGSMSGDRQMKIEDFTVPPDWIPFPTIVAFRHFEIKKIFDFVAGNTTGISDIHRLKMSAHYSDLVVLRAYPELGQKWIQLLGDLYGKTVNFRRHFKDDNPAWQSIQEWLDKQPKASVVYVAFGSEAKPSPHELTEIALGLEKSELPFFWVLRTWLGLSDPDPIELPEGFEERTKKRGVVCTTWKPQLKRLRHESVGGFLTHTGWSSVVEAIQSEKALVLLSFIADQGIIARALE
ncbi:unnamed protein product [Citrullus colocynthis]|uniref:Uncharacterized protein n=1 Tax=Citrullus colocynthis TaxID=252529 RepID=A0ABP0YJ90_9ROSI